MFKIVIVHVIGGVNLALPIYNVAINSILVSSPEVVAICDNLQKHEIMTKQKHEMTEEIVLRKIYQMREKNIMFDADLAELYGVTTTRLNEQVKRNIQRFPEDFMFQITKTEKEWLIKNCIGPHKLKFSPKLPYVFTELGIAMLSSILNSNTAIQVNISIMRIFIKMRHYPRDLAEIISKIQQMEQLTDSNSKSIELLFEYMDELMTAESKKPVNRKLIGFKIKS